VSGLREVIWGKSERKVGTGIFSFPGNDRIEYFKAYKVVEVGPKIFGGAAGTVLCK
jgi:hypothetical protein